MGNDEPMDYMTSATDLAQEYRALHKAAAQSALAMYQLLPHISSDDKALLCAVLNEPKLVSAREALEQIKKALDDAPYDDEYQLPGKAAS